MLYPEMFASLSWVFLSLMKTKKLSRSLHFHFFYDWSNGKRVGFARLICSKEQWEVPERRGRWQLTNPNPATEGCLFLFFKKWNLSMKLSLVKIVDHYTLYEPYPCTFTPITKFPGASLPKETRSQIQFRKFSVLSLIIIFKKYYFLTVLIVFKNAS